MMARIRDINDIDEDEDGQIVDYSGDSDDDNKSAEDLPEEILGTLDTSQPRQYSILREGETMHRDIDLPKPSTDLMLLEKLPKLFPEMVEGGIKERKKRQNLF
jgi:hypothetical protein